MKIPKKCLKTGNLNIEKYTKKLCYKEGAYEIWIPYALKEPRYHVLKFLSYGVQMLVEKISKICLEIGNSKNE